RRRDRQFRDALRPQRRVLRAAEDARRRLAGAVRRTDLDLQGVSRRRTSLLSLPLSRGAAARPRPALRDGGHPRRGGRRHGDAAGDRGAEGAAATGRKPQRHAPPLRGAARPFPPRRHSEGPGVPDLRPSSLILPTRVASGAKGAALLTTRAVEAGEVVARFTGEIVILDEIPEAEMPYALWLDGTRWMIP